MAETETTKCPRCGFDNELTARKCANAHCNYYPLKSDLECLRSIDKSLKTIKGIAIWWLILSLLAILASILYYIDKH